MKFGLSKELKVNRRLVLRVILVILLLAIGTYVISARLSKSAQVNKMVQLSLDLQQAQTDLTNLRQPETIVAGQRDLTVANLLSQLESAKNTSNKNNATDLSKAKFFIATYPAFSFNEISSPLNSAQKASTNYRALVSYHEAIFLGLKPVLEYNPKSDLGNPLLNQDQLKARINLARQGLTKAQTKLSKAPDYDDHNRRELVDTIINLKGRLEAFDADRQKDAWYDDVSTAQTDIINNRQQFWGSQSKTVQTELQAAIEAITDLQQTK